MFSCFLCREGDGDQHLILGDGDICQVRRLDAEKLTALPFVQHPLFPDDQEEVFAIEGGEAMVYQLREAASGKLRALKVSKNTLSPTCPGLPWAGAFASRKRRIPR